MPTYYKYAERNADSQVNWAEVGQGVTDMLKEETNIRIQKKAAIDESTRQFQNTLAAAPQGQFQDGNKFTNNFAHDMMAQQLIDTRLLKSGQMKLQDFTLRRQNYIDGTNQLFDLQKLYQDNYKTTMDGLNSGELQAMTGANMGSVEGFADFSKSKAIINPYTGNINVGIMKPNPETGVMELTKDVVPVNVIKGKILTKIATFKVDDAMNDTVKTLGKDIDYIYKAATTSGAGTVTKLLGKGAFEDLKKEHPEIKNFGDYKGAIDSANSAIEKTMDGYFSDPYHISSVLTQNTGKYHQDSYVYDEKLASKDPSKILLKINPNTGIPTLDENGPHYKDQVNEARDWVRNQLLSKLDKERSIQVTATTPYAPQQREFEFNAGKDEKKAIDTMQDIGALWGGNNAAIGKSLTAFRDINPNIQNMERNDKGVSVTLIGPDKKPQTRLLPFYGNDGKLLTQEEFIKSAAPLLTGNPDAASAIKKGGFIKGATFNPTGSGTATVERGAPEAEKIIVTPSVFTAKSQDAAVQLKNIVPQGFTVEDTGGITGNSILITAPNGNKYPFKTDRTSSKAIEEAKGLQQFLDKNNAGVPAGAPPPNAQGVGSKYGG